MRSIQSVAMPWVELARITSRLDAGERADSPMAGHLGQELFSHVTVLYTSADAPTSYNRGSSCLEKTWSTVTENKQKI